jgi:hypothetical protein
MKTYYVLETNTDFVELHNITCLEAMQEFKSAQKNPDNCGYELTLLQISSPKMLGQSVLASCRVEEVIN